MENNDTTLQEAAYIIGVGVMNWTAVERSLFKLFCSLANTDVTSALRIFYAANFPTQRDILDTLAELKLSDTPEYASFKDVLGKAKDAKKKRDNLAHVSWVDHPGNGRLTTLNISSRGTWKMTTEELSIKELSRRVASIGKAAEIIDEAIPKIAATAKAWHEKHQ